MLAKAQASLAPLALLSLRSPPPLSPSLPLSRRFLPSHRQSHITHTSDSSSMASVHQDIEKVLFTKEQIAERVAALGRQIAADYADKSPHIIGVLRGGFMFMSDLSRAIDPVPRGLTLDFVRASSYGEGATSTSGYVVVESGESVGGDHGMGGPLGEAAIKGRHVILVEDIVDTGLTCSRLVEIATAAGAASVTVAALLDKSSRRRVKCEPGYVGFECPDLFVVGYGLDFRQEYRTLGYVGVLRPELYR